MQWRTLKEDLRLLPKVARVGRALARKHATVGTLVRDQAQAIPDRVLLRFESESVTYAAFNAGVNAFAAVFRQAGVGREPVALMMENSPTLLMAQAAAAKIGAIAALINTHISGAQLTHALRASTARHVFTDATCLPRAVAPPESASLTIWGQGDPAQLPPHVEPLDAALAAAPRNEPATPVVHGNDPFLYLFTSGTTGYAKPALIRHSRFTTASAALGSLLRVEPEDVIYAPLPLYHGQNNFLGFGMATWSGATLASRRRFSPEACLGDVRHHQATVLVYLGELCRYVLRQTPRPDDREHRLRLAVGAGLRPDIWEGFRQRFALPWIVEMYGLTEGNVNLINHSGRVGSVGRAQPFLHSDVRLARCDPESGELARDEHGFVVPCADGEAGELLSRMTWRSLIAFESPPAHKTPPARIAHDAFRRGDRWFRTGDLLRRDQDGYFYFVDRIGDSFRTQGIVVFTQEVAEVLNGAPGVTETNVFAVDIGDGPARVGMAAVVLERGAAFDPRAFYRTARSLPAAAQPVFMRVTPVMDVSGVLKQRKTELQRQGYDPTRITDPLYVRDDAAETYVPLTAAILAQIQRGKWVVSTAPAAR